VAREWEKKESKRKRRGGGGMRSAKKKKKVEKKQALWVGRRNDIPTRSDWGKKMQGRP